MSQRSKVSEIALWRCSLNVFVIFIVIVFVFVFVFVFVVVFLLVRSCFLKTPISFARLGFGLEGFESNTMTKQLVTKVGLELLGQLKIQIRMGIAQIAI